jgi:hypothetical protein
LTAERHEAVKDAPPSRGVSESLTHLRRDGRRDGKPHLVGEIRAGLGKFFWRSISQTAVRPFCIGRPVWMRSAAESKSNFAQHGLLAAGKFQVERGASR